MGKRKQSMAAILHRARMEIEQALKHSGVMKALARFKYDETRVKEGLEKVKRTEKSQRNYASCKGDKENAYEVLQKIFTRANNAYIECLEVARLALKAFPSAVQVLDLKGRRKRNAGGWLEQARQFYTNALSEKEILKRLSNFGIDKERLKADMVLMEKFEQAAADQERIKGKAVKAVQEQKQAFKELQEWMSLFRKIWRFALRDQPELLEYMRSIDISQK
jgi:hypothetical protein